VVVWGRLFKEASPPGMFSFVCQKRTRKDGGARRPTAAYAVCRYDPSREKVNQKNPQIFLIYKLKIKFPLNMARAERRPF